MDLAKWGSMRRKSVSDTLEAVVAKVTSHLESVFVSMTKQEDTGGEESGGEGGGGDNKLWRLY